MTDRRYNEKEMAAIFRAAAEGPQSPQREVPAEEGLTLSDLQAIGREVGISPASVAQAAQALDIRQGASSRTFLGLPIRGGAHGEPQSPAHRSRVGATGRPVARRLQRTRHHALGRLIAAVDERELAGAPRTDRNSPPSSFPDAARRSSRGEWSWAR